MKKCICNHCDQHIEFDESMAGSEVACPSCGMDTKLLIPIKTTTSELPKQPPRESIPTKVRQPPVVEKTALGMHKYKFIVIRGGCGQHEYDIGKCEDISNKMANDGWKLDQVYQETTKSFCGGKPSLIMIFQK